MRWEQLEVAADGTLPGLPEISAARVEIRDGDGRRREVLRLHSSAGWTLDLDDAVDVSAGRGRERIYLIRTESNDRFFILGGPLAYRVSVEGVVEKRVELHRYGADVKFWSFEFHECRQGSCVVYEGGVLLLDQKLDIRWHHRKYYDDRVEAVAAERIDFVGDRDERWSIMLEDGRRADR